MSRVSVSRVSVSRVSVRRMSVSRGVSVSREVSVSVVYESETRNFRSFLSQVACQEVSTVKTKEILSRTDTSG